MFKAALQTFIQDIANQPLTPNVKNPWDYLHPENEIRRQNLVGYFTKMYELKPTVLLVGEAPGYRGCGRVGIPFTSEKLILSHPFFADQSTFSIENVDVPIAEASASIVWKAMDALNFYPLKWATYPYHPHKPGNELSNRAPKPAEVEVGKQFITRLIELYRIEHVLAVGRVAEKTLAGMGIAATPLRHPSHGGAVQFSRGLATFRAKWYKRS